MGHVDIHCHLLPGIDDGAASLAETVEMLSLAGAAGTDQIVATPHMFQPDIGSDDVDLVRHCWRNLCANLETLEIEGAALALPTVHLGAENYVGAELLAAVSAGEVLTLSGSRFLLVELWPLTTGTAARHALDHIASAGYTPVLAHVERYGFLRSDPSALPNLVEAGYVAQVNAAAILGRQGLKIAQLVDHWLRRGLIAVVASDGHGVDSRQPKLDAVAELLAKRHGKTTAELLLQDNPRALLAGAEPTLPSLEPRRRWWQRLDS